MAADVSIGINVVWDNQKDMQKAKDDLLSLNKAALISADSFGTSSAEIDKSIKAMLPSIKTSSQALKKFSNEGYQAWTSYQKEVDEATKGTQKALTNQVKNMQAGFDKLSKSPEATIEQMKEYIVALGTVQAKLARVTELNKKVSASFSASSFLGTVNKTKKATAEWTNETVALSQAMDTIAKKGRTLEFANSNGKQTENIKALRTEYIKLQTQLNSINSTKFNKAMQSQFTYTQETKGSLEALKEKYKTLDAAIRGMISSGDLQNLESYKMKLNTVSNAMTKLETASAKFDKGGFFTSLDKNSEAIEAMDGRLAAVNARMKMLRTTILKVTEAGNANESEVRQLREEYAKLSTEQKTLQKESNGTATRIKNLIKSFVSAQAIVWAVRTVFMKLINTLKEAAEVAAAAEETMNLFDVVFEGVGDSADEMASKMSKAFGVAQSSIAQGLSTLGDFSEGLGMSNQAALDFSNTLSARMLDVISFKNVAGDTTDILKNLASGLAGNTENFRTWGVVIKEASVGIWLAENNMDKLTGTALELAKVQARAALFMNQTTNAAGDMARTFDSTVNVARRLTEANKQLNENMGVGFNKIVTPVKKGLLGIVESWNLATAAKKEYADVEAFKSENNAKANAKLDALISTYLKVAGQKELTEGSIGETLTGRVSKIADIATNVSPIKGLYDKSALSTASTKLGTLGTEDLNHLLKGAGESIETVIASLDRLGIEYDKSAIEEIKQQQIQAKLDKANTSALASLEEFGETLKLWTSTGSGGIYSAVTENLNSMLTPFETATGTERSTTELATSYQSELKVMFEETYNKMVTAQNEGFTKTAELAKTTLDTITKQYKETQRVIDQEAKNAKLDAQNAEDFKNAVEAFKSSMDDIVANIDSMNSSIAGLMRDAGVSASMLGADSSMVSIGQNRATALSGVRAQNLAAEQDFATEKGFDLSKYREAISTVGESDLKNSSTYKEYEALIKGQANSLKTTNDYYDLLASNAKMQLGYSDAQTEISAMNVQAYKDLANATLLELDAKVKSGAITQQYYDDEKKIFNDNINSLKNLNLDKIAETMSGLGGISTTKSLSIGGGVFSGATDTYTENLAKLDEIRASVIESSGGIENVSKENSDLLASKLKDVENAFDIDKLQAVLDVTGISSSPDMEMFTNIQSIMTSDDDLAVKLGETLLYVLSTFDSFQDAMSIVSDSLAELAPLVDSFLAPIMLLLEPLTSLLGDVLTPILIVLFPIIQKFILALLPAIAIVDTVVVWLGAFAGMIKDIVTFNWGHVKKNFTKASDKTVDIWTDLNDNLKEVAALTVNTTSELSDANSDYIDAVNDMMGKGLLTGQEALELVSKQAGTSYTGDSYQYLDKNAYGSYDGGAGTMNIGTMNIDAKGKTIEQVLEETRRAYYEKKVTGGIVY